MSTPRPPASPLDPFARDHPGGYLADSQFDYPGQPGGWRYHALDGDNRFAPFEPIAASQGTMTPLAYLGCDDPQARVGRDFVHPGYQRRPCLQWHVPAAGTYRIEGEVALVYSHAHGHFRVRVIVDDKELLTQTLSYPQVLTFAIDAAVGQGGFVRVLFECVSHIDSNDALFYLRTRHGDEPCASGECRVSSRCDTAPAWDRLGEALVGSAEGAVSNPMSLAIDLYQPRTPTDPVALQMLQQVSKQQFGSLQARYRQPRYFSAQPSTNAVPPKP